MRNKRQCVCVYLKHFLGSICFNVILSQSILVLLAVDAVVDGLRRNPAISTNRIFFIFCSTWQVRQLLRPHTGHRKSLMLSSKMHQPLQSGVLQ